MQAPTPAPDHGHQPLGSGFIVFITIGLTWVCILVAVVAGTYSLCAFMCLGCRCIVSSCSWDSCLWISDMMDFLVGVKDLRPGPRIIRSIPSTKYALTSSSAANAGSDNPCSICLLIFSNTDLCKELLCGHCFHSECLDEWLLQSILCPVRSVCSKRCFWCINSNLNDRAVMSAASGS